MNDQIRNHAANLTILDRLQKHRTVRWAAFSATVGVLSGLMACVVFYLLEWATFFSMEYLAGYHTLKPGGEHLVDLVSDTPFRQWALCLLPAIGGLLSGLLVYTWAPEAEGHGTDAFIDAFHNKSGHIRTRVPFIKGIASVITLATGGSAGREGPIAQIGAGIGSWLGRALGLSVRERRLLLLAGCAAGLGAIFRAPLGGALTSIEVLYREDFEAEGIILCIISSVVGYAIFTTVFGHEPIFDIPPVQFRNPLELLFYGALALVCVPFGYAYVRVFYGLRDYFFRRIPLKKAFIPALGGAMVGIVAIWTPQVLSGGYGVIQQALRGDLTFSLMFAVAAVKILATSFTISSGGSGGVFGPSLFIGAMLGGAVGQLGHQWFPSIVSHPGAFALVGMGAFFAGVAKAPIGALLMVCEMTGGYGLVVPLMFASVVAILLSQRWSLYEKQVLNKFHSPAHRSDTVVNVLQSMRVKDVYRKDAPVLVLPEDMTFAQFKKLFKLTRESFFPVVDDEFHLRGILAARELREVIFEEDVADLLVLADLVSPPVFLELEENLYDALLVFLRTGYGQIPIIDSETGLLGLLRLEDLMAAYHREISKVRES
ncbi:MAG: chloride channel protein [Syntrophobacteraceae bacterium]